MINGQLILYVKLLILTLRYGQSVGFHVKPVKSINDGAGNNVMLQLNLVTIGDQVAVLFLYGVS